MSQLGKNLKAPRCQVECPPAGTCRERTEQQEGTALSPAWSVLVYDDQFKSVETADLKGVD